MSWLRNSPLRTSFSRQISRPIDPGKKCDPDACFETFCKHWQQAEEIIQRTQDTNIPNQDDVLGVVSHLEHLVTLLLLEIRNDAKRDTEQLSTSNFGAGGVCLERLLSENLLDKLYEWGSNTGRYVNAVRLEQMKLYSLLMTHSGQQLLCAEPFLRPLLKLLCSFRTELLPEEVEGRLVCLLGQLCVVLMQKTQFVDLFFFPAPHETKNSSFVPVMLLLSYVHREGSLGQQARAALLLCAAISARNESVAEYIAKRSNVCPLLATGLSGLYSLLPRNIDVSQADWHRLTPDDVNDINKLGLFMNSLEFCNAVAQVAHHSIRQLLLDFFYQGFLLPVMGPALLQKKPGQSTTRPPYLQSGVDEQVAAIAYLELSLRSVSDPGLLKSLIKFLLDKNYDGANILDTVVPFINGEPRLSIVTISLLETLVDLNCEDLMIELVFKYLMGGKHLMVSHRRRSLDCDLQCRATSMFLALSPECCTNRPQIPASKKNNTVSRKPSISSLDQNMSSLTSINEQGPASMPHFTKNVPQTTFAYGLNASESLYGNYHAYLCEARRKILSCKKSCSKWSSNYDGYCNNNNLPKLNSNKVINVVKDFQLEHSNLVKGSSTASVPNENDETLVETSNSSSVYTNNNNKEEDSLQSIGESSGYESFKYRGDDHHSTPENESTITEDESKEFAEDSFWKSASTIERICNNITNDTVVKDIKSEIDSNQSTDINIGPLLTVCLEKLGKMLGNNVYVNLRLTSLLSRLAVYPSPLLRSFLLCPWVVLQPSITSLYQILVSIKQQIDESVLNEPESSRLFEEAQAFLIDREIRLANTRKNAIENVSSKSPNNSETGKNVLLATQFTQHGVQYQNSGDTTSPVNSGNSESTSPIQTMAIYEPFRRNEPKRRSLSSFTSMFSRKLNSGGITGSPPSNPPTYTDASTSPRSSIDSLPYSSMSEDNLWHSTTSRKIILNSLILDEWLKELGALAQEHVVCSISELIQEPTFDLLGATPAQNKIL